MTNPDDESNELKAFGGWLLFGVLGALAVIGAFLTIGNNDDADHTPITAPDAVETGAAGSVDFDAVIAAMAAAGVETPTAVATGADRIRVGGTLPSEAFRRAAVAAARSEVASGIAVDTAFGVAAQVADAPEPDEAATDEEADSAFGSIDELAGSLGLSAGDYGVIDGVMFVRGGTDVDTSLFTQLFGVDVVEITPDGQRRSALAILQQFGVVAPNVVLLNSDPIELSLRGEVPDGVRASDIVREVQAIPFVDGISIDFTTPAPPADPIVTFTVDGGVVTLTGTVADEATRAAVVAEAGRLFGAGNIVDELVVGEVGPGALQLVGRVPEARRADIEASMADLAASLGLELADGFEYTELDADQAALQDELATLTADIQINFASGSSALPGDAPAQLDTLVDAINAAPAGVRVSVEGHTDDQGDAGSNQSLSEARAQAVADYLISQGVDAERLRAVGNGESQPIADNGTAEGRAANRRIEFNVVV